MPYSTTIQYFNFIPWKYPKCTLHKW